MTDLSALVDQVRSVLIETNDSKQKHEIYNQFLNECNGLGLNENDFYLKVLKVAHKSIHWELIEEEKHKKKLEEELKREQEEKRKKEEELQKQLEEKEKIKFQKAKAAAPNFLNRRIESFISSGIFPQEEMIAVFDFAGKYELDTHSIAITIDNLLIKNKFKPGGSINISSESLADTLKSTSWFQDVRRNFADLEKEINLYLLECINTEKSLSGSQIDQCFKNIRKEDEDDILKIVNSFIRINELVPEGVLSGASERSRITSVNWIKKDLEKFDSKRYLRIISIIVSVVLLYILIVRPILDNDYLQTKETLQTSNEIDTAEDNKQGLQVSKTPIVEINDSNIPNDDLSSDQETNQVIADNNSNLSIENESKSVRTTPESSSVNSVSTNSSVKDDKSSTSTNTQLGVSDEVQESEPQNVPQIGKSLKKSKNNNNSILTPVVRTYTGNIGLFDVELTLEFTTVNTKCKEQGLMVSGKYFYASKPLSKKWIGGHTCGNAIVLNETDGVGAIKATFTGVLDGNGSIKGKYQTENGQKIGFYLK